MKTISVSSWVNSLRQVYIQLPSSGEFLPKTTLGSVLKVILHTEDAYYTSRYRKLTRSTEIKSEPACIRKRLRFKRNEGVFPLFLVLESKPVYGNDYGLEERRCISFIFGFKYKSLEHGEKVSVF